MQVILIEANVMVAVPRHGATRVISLADLRPQAVVKPISKTFQHPLDLHFYSSMGLFFILDSEKPRTMP